MESLFMEMFAMQEEPLIMPFKVAVSTRAWNSESEGKNIDQGQEVIIRRGETGCRAKVLMSELLINATVDQ